VSDVTDRAGRAARTLPLPRPGKAPLELGVDGVVPRPEPMPGKTPLETGVSGAGAGAAAPGHGSKARTSQ
jgi:hypothetical protein